MIAYKIKKSTQKDLLLHLEKCDALFVPALSSKVDLTIYADKLTNNAQTFEAWYDVALIGVIAAYFNDLQTKTGFITSVSVLEKYNNQGIATQLMKLTKEYAIQNGFEKIQLEVHPENENAIRFYTKEAFKITTKETTSIIMEYDINKS